MKNVAFKLIGNVMMTAHGANSPSDSEFAPFLAQFKTCQLDRLRVVSFTKGGAPTPAQRKQVNDALAGREVPVAIITETRLIRGVITAMSWFNKNQRAFAPDEFEDAFRHVDIPAAQHDHFVRELHKLQAELEKPETTSTGFKAAPSSNRR